MANLETAGGGPGGGWRDGRLPAAVMLVGVALSLVSARLVPGALFGLLAATAIGTLLAGGVVRRLLPEPGPVLVALAGFLALCLASTLWAEAGSKAIGKLVAVTAMTAAALVLVHAMLTSSQGVASRTARALSAGLAVGLAFLLVELSSGQSIQISAYNVLHMLGVAKDTFQPVRHFTWTGDTLAAIEPAHINRNLAVAALLAFPASLAAFASFERPWRGPAAAAIVAAAALAASLSRHESSLVALAAGAVIFAVAWISRAWGLRMLAAGWVLAWIAVLPFAVWAGRTGADKIPWLHHSMQHRVIIWNYTAEETLKSPFIGIGAYMTYVLGPERNKKEVLAPGEEYKKTLSRHAHNVFLQTWYELGAAGALLLMLAGVAVLGGIRRLGHEVQPWAQATFAAAATMMSASYGMWQTWYLALFALVAVALAAAARAKEANGLAEP